MEGRTSWAYVLFCEPALRGFVVDFRLSFVFVVLGQDNANANESDFVRMTSEVIYLNSLFI